MLTSFGRFMKCPAQKSESSGMGLLLLFWGMGEVGKGMGAAPRLFVVLIGPFSSLFWNGATV